MLEALVAFRLITPPAIWGKLPGHADFVRSGMHHGESESWQSWLALHRATMASVPMAGALAASFVLPPGTLSFAMHRFVVGAIMPSCDRVGRRHALLVYQSAHPRWVELHFAQQVAHSKDWLFWLARAVAHHATSERVVGVQALDDTVQALWKLHAPSWRELVASGPESSDRVLRRSALSQALVARAAGPARIDQSGAQPRGVRYLPWADWPQRLFKTRPENAFWQQDENGCFVNAANSVSGLWRAQP